MHLSWRALDGTQNLYPSIQVNHSPRNAAMPPVTLASLTVIPAYAGIHRAARVNKTAPTIYPLSLDGDLCKTQLNSDNVP